MWFHFYEVSRMGKLIQRVSRLVMARTRRENWEVSANSLWVSLEGAENVLKLIVVMVARL